jgi:cell division protein FtsQ
LSAITARVRLPSLSRPALPPKLGQRLLMVFAACLVLAALYLFWFRDSSFVRVEKVTITGLTTQDEGKVRSALTSVGRSMTTLHVDRGALDQVVEGYPVVRSLRVSPDFPHTLRIRVIEYRAAAMAVTDDGRVPVASDGTVLRGLPISGSLPTVHADGGIDGSTLGDREAIRAARVAGAAPEVLQRRILEVRKHGSKGLVATLKDGPDLIFGEATRLRAKWIAAARVLASPAAAGATYLDLRLPGRPAAGGLPAETVAPVAPAGTTATPAPQAATTAPPAATAQPDDTAAQALTQETPQTTTPAAPTLDGGAGGGATANTQP